MFEWTPHRFVGGLLVLDVCNSVIMRHDPSRRVDRFAAVSNVETFVQAAMAWSAESALLTADPNRGTAPIMPLLVLREAADRHFRRIASTGQADDVSLVELADAAAGALRSPVGLARATARSALMLVEGQDEKRLKICGNCGWLFVDRSRNQSRIWCDMAVCGNRIKASRHYQSRRRPPEGALR